MNYIIGFAYQYYTLWEHEKVVKTLKNGRRLIKETYKYVKNISKDKGKAFASYPNATYDENLKGQTSSFSKDEIIWDSIDVFRFGKYMFQKIEDVNDLKYTAWYAEHTFPEDHWNFLKEYLQKNGYEVRETEYRIEILSPEDLEEERKHKEAVEKLHEHLKAMKPIVAHITENPNDRGEVLNGENMLCLIFPSVRENTYDGYTYYLPILNGKQKRIKNKTIIIKKYTFEPLQCYCAEFIVHIADFEVQKEPKIVEEL